MDKSSSTKGQQDQVQAIYLAQANIFAYEARKSNKSWVPLCDSTVPISILYDNTRSIYRIISVDADIKEVVVNTTIIPELEFVKTTQKFGYWKDVASGRVFGIGFASEFEAEAFDECLRKVKQNIGPPSVNSSVNLNSTTDVGQQQRTSLHHDTLQGQGDGPGQPTKLPLVPSTGSNIGGGQQSTSSLKKLNWDDYEQIGPTVLSFLNSNRQQAQNILGGNTDGRPSTYKVDLPVIGGTSAPPSAQQPPAASKIFTTNLDELRLGHGTQAPPPPAYHHPLSFPYYSQQPPPRPLPLSSSTADSSMGGAGPATPSSMSSPLMPSTNMMPIGMSLPHGYCYQGPPPSGHPTQSGGGDALPLHYADPLKANQKPTPDYTTARDRNDLLEEINRIKTENIKLSESLIESTCNAKKWELQVNSLREDNISLVKSVAELNSKLEQASKESREYKEQASRWKEHYQQAVSSAKEKSQQLKDAEEKIKSSLSDKTRIESVMKDLEEELKRQQQINKEQLSQNNGHVVSGQYTNKYFKELEDHYRKLLTDSQKRIEEILRKDGDRKNILRGVDTLFTGAIQGLINIHGQIRQAYEQ